MELQELLYRQGFGTRRICAGLVQQGHVSVEGLVVTDAGAEVEAHEGLAFTVRGEAWTYHAKAYLMLHKPAGIECSQRPSAWPSVYTLLPAPLRQRPSKGGTDGVQAIGRLDQDTAEHFARSVEKLTRSGVSTTSEVATDTVLDLRPVDLDEPTA